MGEVLKLPYRKKATRNTQQERVLSNTIDDPYILAALMALYDNDKRLDRMASRTFTKIFKRLETLEALVFAQSIMIAELQGHPLTPEQKGKIAAIMRVKS